MTPSDAITVWGISSSKARANPPQKTRPDRASGEPRRSVPSISDRRRPARCPPSPVEGAQDRNAGEHAGEEDRQPPGRDLNIIEALEKASDASDRHESQSERQGAQPKAHRQAGLDQGRPRGKRLPCGSAHRRVCPRWKPCSLAHDILHPLLVKGTELGRPSTGEGSPVATAAKGKRPGPWPRGPLQHHRDNLIGVAPRA